MAGKLQYVSLHDICIKTAVLSLCRLGECAITVSERKVNDVLLRRQCGAIHIRCSACDVPPVSQANRPMAFRFAAHATTVTVSIET